MSALASRARLSLGVCIFSSLLFAAYPRTSRADVALGGHFGVNLNEGHPMVGADLRVDIVELSPRVSLDLWGAYTHVFIENGLDVNMLELDVPFVFDVNADIVTPYVAPGLGISFSGGSTLKLNLIGGCLFHLGERFEPFVQLAVRMVDGTYVDLMGGLLVRL
jgi:hypothetical protein